MLPKVNWEINPKIPSKSDICLYQTIPRKNVNHMKTYSPFKISIAKDEEYNMIDKFLCKYTVLDNAERYCMMIRSHIDEDLASKTVEQLYLSLKKKLPQVPKKFIHLYLLGAAYIKSTKSLAIRSAFVDMNIKSIELGKYSESGTEEDLLNKIKLYIRAEDILTSHTYPFIIALLCHKLYNKVLSKT